MKSLRVGLLGGLMVLCASYAQADTVPPTDPSVGVGGGGLSTPITSTMFTFTLVLCSQPSPPPECTSGLFTNPQAVFAGENLSGVPFGNIQLTVNLPNPLEMAVLLSCSGGSLFTENDCPDTLPAGTMSFTFTLFKGTGTGIGCFDPEVTDQANQDCLVNSIATLLSGSGDFYQNPETSSCPDIPNEVCGPRHFVIAVGFDNLPWPENSIPTGGTAVANVPEPSTLALLLTGLSALAMRRKRRITPH